MTSYYFYLYIYKREKVLNCIFHLLIGLLWIWSTSARPINPNTNLTSFNNKNEVVNKIPVKVLNQNKTQQTNSTTITTNFPEIIGDGRCLRISYNPSKFGYGYVGADCIAKQVSLVSCQLEIFFIKLLFFS